MMIFSDFSQRRDPKPDIWIHPKIQRNTGRTVLSKKPSIPTGILHTYFSHFCGNGQILILKTAPPKNMYALVRYRYRTTYKV
jgi:hypothetical protein